MSRINAMVQYNCIPHYRARIFELLSECSEVNFYIVADSDPDTPHLYTIGDDSKRKINHIRFYAFWRKSTQS